MEGDLGFCDSWEVEYVGGKDKMTKDHQVMALNGQN